MTVSREDIDYNQLTPFGVDERFIKLPVENYLELLGVTPLRPQIAFINAVNSPKYRFVVGALSRRTGKTFAANVIAQLVTLIPNKNVLIMSPNYNLSEISFREQRNLLKRFSVEVEKDNAKDRIIELVNGSTIRMGSVSQVDSCVGRSYDLILFDEAALHPDGEHAFQIALRPTLDKPGAKAIFISTPRGKNNWFSSYYQRGFGDLFPEWCSIWSDYRENDRMDEKDVEEARRSMTKAEFSQEYEASFVAFEGQIFDFDSDKCIFDTMSEVPEGLEYIIGVDVGFRDPTGIVVIGHHYETNTYYVVDEYLKAEKTTSMHAKALQELMEKWDAQVVFIDAAAAQTRFDWAADFDIPSVAAKKSVLDGITKVQTIIEHNKLYVKRDCVNTLATLDQYSWDAKATLEKERPKHDDYSHIADALRYALYTYSISIAEV